MKYIVAILLSILIALLFARGIAQTSNTPSDPQHHVHGIH